MSFPCTLGEPFGAAGNPLPWDSSKFLYDAVEAFGGFDWKLKTSIQNIAPFHLIAALQYLNTENLNTILSSDYTSKPWQMPYLRKGFRTPTCWCYEHIANALKKTIQYATYFMHICDECR